MFCFLIFYVILIFLFVLSIILLSHFHFVARKIAVTLRQISYSAVNELSSSETRLISTSSGIVMALALKTKMGNK